MEYIPGENSAAALNIDRIRRERKKVSSQHLTNVNGSSRALLSTLHYQAVSKDKKKVDEETNCKSFIIVELTIEKIC